MFSITNAELDLPIDDDMTIFKLLELAMKGIINILVPIMVLLLVFVGFLFIKAQGNSNDIQKAKDALENVIIGIFLVFLSYFIFKIVKEHLAK